MAATTATADGLSQLNETNVIGFLLTTTSGDLSNLVPSEIVVVPVQNLSGAGSGGGIMNVLQGTHHHQALTINGVNVVNSNQNIAIMASNSNALMNNNVNVSTNGHNDSNISCSGNNVISSVISSNSSKNSSVSVTHPILTHME
jgi:hypothetical protein